MGRNRSQMRVAQRLYENGYITYMRTDSINLSQQAISAARSAAKALYGADHVAMHHVCIKVNLKTHKKHTKRFVQQVTPLKHLASQHQSCHVMSLHCTTNEKRTVASQMADAKKMQMRVDFDATTNDGKKTIFRANGSVITFPGSAAYDDIVTDEK